MASYRIRKSTKSKSWMCSYKNHLGHWRYKSGFKTKYDAMLWHDTYIENLKPVQNNKLTIKNAAMQYLELHTENHCKPSTYKFYESIIRCHLVPLLGHLRINELTIDHLNLYIKEKKKHKLSNRTINHTLTVLETIYNYLVASGKTKTSPLFKFKKLEAPNIEMMYLNIEEIELALSFCKLNDPKFYPLLLTAIYTGLRQGELIALSWDNIYFVRKKIKVVHSYYKGNLTTPKNGKTREVDIPDSLVKVLKELKLNSKYDLVFHGKDGGYLDPTSMVKRHFKPILAACNLPNVRFHDLRHTYATILLEHVPIKYIQKQLGHSSIEITMNTYSHLLPQISKNAVQVLDSIINVDDNSIKEFA